MDPEFLKRNAHVTGRTAEMVADIIADDIWCAVPNASLHVP